MQNIPCHKVVRRTEYRVQRFFSQRQTPYARRRTKKGFTLVELVLVIALIALVAGIIAPIMVGGLRSYVMISSQKAALAQVRLAMARMSAEIRLIPDTGSIDTWNASELRFDLPDENNIRYRVQNNDLQRSNTDIAANVSNLNFTYLNSSGNPAGAKADIYRIGVEMTLDAAGGQGSITARTEIFPRRFSNAYADFD